MIGLIYEFNKPISPNAAPSLIIKPLSAAAWKFNLNNETAIDIEFYDDTVLIGTKEGSVFLYKYLNNNLLKYVGTQRANSSKVKDLLYDKDNVYVISNNGAIVIIPVSNFINNTDFNDARTPVSIMFGEGNHGNVIESFTYDNKKYFITADEKGNLVF